MTIRYPQLACTVAALLMLLMSGAPALHAKDLNGINLHGFVSQGYLYSKENNFYGESTDGSWDFYEAGVGGIYRVDPKLSIAGQLYARDAGRGDDGSIRTDYFYADYRFFQSAQSGAGFRAGRVRNPYGFYNSTRDIFFTRPSILLPQLYYEGYGIRELFFSSDGLQLYNYWDSDQQSTHFIATFGRTDDIDSNTFENIFGSQGGLFSGQAELRRPFAAQLSTDLMGGRWRAAMSYYDATLTFDSPQAIAELDANIIALSLQHNREKISYTLEYSLLSTNGLFASPAFGAAGNFASKGETAYLQADYQQTGTLTWYTRIDHQLGDRNRPNETDSTVLTLGGRWAPAPNWLLAAEVHGVRGSAPVPNIDNPNRQISERSELFVMMAGYRF